VLVMTDAADNCSAADIDEAFIASSRALAITGTHFSTPGVHAASCKALECARRQGVRTVLDIDYRPVLWGLTSRADGETRFIADDGVTAHLQTLLSRFDLVVGTEEEFLIAGGSRDLLAARRAVRAVTDATLVVKRGPMGCSVIEQNIPARTDELPIYLGCRVEVLNVLGAGDAFMAGFLYGWLRDGPSRPSMASGALGLLPGETLERCCTYANACGAIVVSRHGCAPAMPSRAELEYFLANAQQLQRPDRDEELAHLHRVSVARPQWDDLHVLAFDQRTLFLELSRECTTGELRLPRLNQLMADAVEKIEREPGQQRKTGVLIDARYGEDALHAATGRGWWVGRPIEMPGSVPFESSHHRSIGSQLQTWPAEHVVQWRVELHADADTQSQPEFDARLRTLYDAVKQSGHELLLEVAPPPSANAGSAAAERVLNWMKHIYDLGIRPEWWKLTPLPAQGWAEVDALIVQRDRYCRGVLLLGPDKGLDELAAGISAAAQSRTCRGFATVAVFYRAGAAWLRNEIDDATLISNEHHESRSRGLWRKARSQAGPLAVSRA
jgi:5-dehydro-2-deoxygluconokinase